MSMRKHKRRRLWAWPIRLAIYYSARQWWSRTSPTRERQVRLRADKWDREHPGEMPF